MKIRYFFISIVLCVFSTKATFAQNASSTYSIKADSLYQLIDKHHDEDELLVRLLNEYARLCFFNYDYQKGLSATREARIISDRLEFDGGKIMYYLTLSTYFRNGEMYNYYQRQAQWLSKNINEQLSEYFTDMNIPDYDKTNFQELLYLQSANLKHFEELGDKEIQAVILADIAFYHFRLGNLEETINSSEKIVNLYSELDQVYPVYLYKSRIMNFLHVLGRKDEALEIELELIELIAQNENTNAIGIISSTMANGFANNGRYALSIEYYLKSLDAFERNKDSEMLIQTHYWMGVAYENLNMDSRAVDSYAKCLAEIQNINDSSRLFIAYNYMVSPLIALKRYDEARKYMTLSLYDTISGNRTYILARYNDAQGQIIRDVGDYAGAIPYFQKAYEGFIQPDGSRWAAPFMPLYLSECYLKTGDFEQALKQGLLCLEMDNALNYNNTGIKSRVSLLLSEIYEQLGNQSKAFEYLKMHQQIRAESDKLDEANRIADGEVRAIIDKSQQEIGLLEKQKVEKEQQNRVQRLWILSIAGALISAIIVAFILFRNNKNKQKANLLLQEQKEEIQVTLEKLEATQSQLIQSEKMASLGELTAGIAHEIQNPLNFVNNFSDVSKELMGELKDERSKGKEERDEKLEDEILEDIDQNLNKINNHGMRASDIVKSMLQHSRASSGEKELTDINTLCDEYLRLAYHGMRAKDKSFNAEFKTDLDADLPKINLIAQDIGRVLLNLINNAFQAVAGVEKPEVVVSSKKLHNKVLISIADNGPGIPDEIKDKIFQPFFTTKPTGQGTGLGLSLSYDIVKAHGGELKVETKEKEGTTFYITLSQ